MPGKNSLIMPSRLTVLWHYLEFLPGVYPVTNALTISIYSFLVVLNTPPFLKNCMGPWVHITGT